MPNPFVFENPLLFLAATAAQEAHLSLCLCVRPCVCSYPSCAFATFGNCWQLLAAFWQLLATFGNFWHLFGNCWHLLATFSNFWHLLVNFGNFWQFLATFSNFLQLSVTFGNFWQLMVTSGNFWQLLATFGNFLQPMATYSNFATLQHYNFLYRPAGRTSWMDQMDWPVGRTSWTDQMDGPAEWTSSLYLKPWPVCIFEDWCFSIVAATESDKGLVFLWLPWFNHSHRVTLWMGEKFAKGGGRIKPFAAILVIFSCNEQLKKWHCHSVCPFIH